MTLYIRKENCAHRRQHVHKYTLFWIEVLDTRNLYVVKHTSIKCKIRNKVQTYFGYRVWDMDSISNHILEGIYNEVFF